MSLTANRHLATFFFSMGRCGTQWLADRLAKVAGPEATVTHEGWQDHGLTRRVLGVNQPKKIKGGERLIAHAEQIESALETGPYFETGFPIWSSLPWFLKRLEGRVRLVHLVRHPVDTALSWLSHGAWQEPLFTHLPPGRVLLEATDEGVMHTDYRHRWDSMAPFEKALFYWLEVNSAALRLENEAKVDWLRLPFETLFSPSGSDQLRTFLNLPSRLLENPERSKRVDQWSMLIMNPVDWRAIGAHPEILALCNILGYDPMAVDVEKMRARFGPAVLD